MRFYIALFSFIVGLLPLSVQAAEKAFPQLFAEATGLVNKPLAHSGNGFAAGQTYQGPYGGSYTVDYGRWAGSSGTVTMSYNNFVIPISASQRMIYNGNWSYTGSVLSNGYLEGTLTGQWTISGLGQGLDNLSWSMNVKFTAGMAYLTMTIQGLPPITLSFSQKDMLALLL